MNYTNAAIEFYKQYSAGQREFNFAKLQRADLRRKILSKVNLRNADLSHANLKKADFSSADLRRSCLFRADLSSANLTGTNLTGADLSEVNLSLAELREAKLNRAFLNKAFLIGTNLIFANLSYADLTGTDLSGANLRDTTLNGAFYDEHTIFPLNFSPIEAGMIQKYTVAELLKQFNNVYKSSNRYFGHILSAKYFYSSQPNFEWLNQFEINKFKRIIFQGSVEESISPLQFRWFQVWIHDFIESCSQIIKDFPKLI